MGNRAVIQLNNSDYGIYLHWNGGRDSVEAFLLAAKTVMGGTPCSKGYGAARLVQCITCFFGGNLSVGMGPLRELDCDNGNNGLYQVDTSKMEIVGRKYFEGVEQHVYNVTLMAKEIVSKVSGEETPE